MLLLAVIDFIRALSYICSLNLSILASPPFARLIDIPLNARWKKDGFTVAGGHGKGCEMNQLYYPLGLFVDDDQTIYVADPTNRRVMKWKYGATSGQVVAGGDTAGEGIHSFDFSWDVAMDRERGSIFISDRGNGRIVRWPRTNYSNTNEQVPQQWMDLEEEMICTKTKFYRCSRRKTPNSVYFRNLSKILYKQPPAAHETVRSHLSSVSGEVVISNIDCTGLALDENGFLYVIDSGNHEIRRYRMDSDDETTVAGGYGVGSGLNRLSAPSYVCVGRDSSVYVSDLGYHRVVEWKEGAKEGVVIAGGNGVGSSRNQLDRPQGLAVDQLGSVYIVDQNNHRVVRWTKGSTWGTVIVGGYGAGERPDQLNFPSRLSFDRHGNLYVTDSGNCRVQKFEIEVNIQQDQACRF